MANILDLSNELLLRVSSFLTASSEPSFCSPRWSSSTGSCERARKDLKSLSATCRKWRAVLSPLAETCISRGRAIDHMPNHFRALLRRHPDHKSIKHVHICASLPARHYCDLYLQLFAKLETVDLPNLLPSDWNQVAHTLSRVPNIRNLTIHFTKLGGLDAAQSSAELLPRPPHPGRALVGIAKLGASAVESVDQLDRLAAWFPRLEHLDIVLSCDEQTLHRLGHALCHCEGTLRHLDLAYSDMYKWCTVRHGPNTPSRRGIVRLENLAVLEELVTEACFAFVDQLGDWALPASLRRILDLDMSSNGQRVFLEKVGSLLYVGEDRDTLQPNLKEVAIRYDPGLKPSLKRFVAIFRRVTFEPNRLRLKMYECLPCDF